MGKTVDQLRIENAIKHIDLAMDNLKDIGPEEFEKNSLVSRAVSFSVVQIGEMLNRLKEKIGDKHPEIEWALAKGMRNVLVHDYVEVDLERVYDTVKNDLPRLKEQLQALLD